MGGIVVFSNAIIVTGHIGMIEGVIVGMSKGGSVRMRVSVGHVQMRVCVQK